MAHGVASLVEPEDILIVGPVVIVAGGICSAFTLLSRGVVKMRMLTVPVAVIAMQLTAASAVLYQVTLDRCVVTSLLDTRREVFGPQTDSSVGEAATTPTRRRSPCATDVYASVTIAAQSRRSAGQSYDLS
jgi:hypothetical protein